MSYVLLWLKGTLRFGKFDVTETQLTVIFLHLISALFGTGVWDYEVSLKYLCTLI